MLNSIVALLNAGAGGGGGAYESIATVTGTGSAGSITFSSIPSTYKHLQIRARGRASDAGTIDAFANVTFNADSGSNYTRHFLTGDGTTVSATGAASQTSIRSFQFTGALQSAQNTGVGILDIIDYASTSKYKTIRSFNGYDVNGSGYLNLSSGLWMSTSAVNSLTITLEGATTFSTLTVFSLYGIKGA